MPDIKVCMNIKQFIKMKKLNILNNEQIVQKLTSKN